ncbi:hypothetical protein D3C81_2189350 [compost metagenome]
MFEAMYYEAHEFTQLLKNGQRESSINSHETSLAVAEVMEEARQQIGLRYASDL